MVNDLTLEVGWGYLELLLSEGLLKFSTDSLVHLAQLCEDHLNLGEAFFGFIDVEVQVLFVRKELFYHALVGVAAVILSDLVRKIKSNG